MTSHRIEITFSGEAPDEELKRAQILAGADVLTAIGDLSGILDKAGFAHTVTARSVRSVPKPRRLAAE